jgi:hypothetical protein
MLLLAVPAAAERDCTPAQTRMIEAALPDARKRVEDAKLKVKGSDPKATKAGRLTLGGGYNEKEVAAVLDLMSAQLAAPKMRCAEDSDKNCGSRAGYYRSDRKGEMYLCPKFFNQKPGEPGDPTPAEQRVRTVVHESAHMAHPNISEPGGESYCVVFTCEDSCGEGPYDPDQGKNIPARVADNWSQFVHCASGQKPDEAGMIISGGGGKKKPKK